MVRDRERHQRQREASEIDKDQKDCERSQIERHLIETLERDIRERHQRETLEREISERDIRETSEIKIRELEKKRSDAQRYQILRNISVREREKVERGRTIR